MSPGSRLRGTDSGPILATLIWPSGSAGSAKYTSSEICPWMLTGCTFRISAGFVPFNMIDPRRRPSDASSVGLSGQLAPPGFGYEDPHQRGGEEGCRGQQQRTAEPVRPGERTDR